MRTVCVVLAAGSSRRLGSPKQLAEYAGEPLVRHAARVGLGAGCDETVVVVSSAAVAAAVRDLSVRVLMNDAASEGVASSIRLVAEAAGEARILFTLCDQPLVTTEHLRKLLAEPAAIVATGYRGIAGVPAAFIASFRPALLSLRGDEGARAIIDANRDRLIVVPFEDAGVDVDTVDDLRKLM